ncbi:MAG: hypothetical protein A3E01_02775 [Gammaproteobacteria bacterium RIFCSPHIGHO2_12_FULL_63_22]|nr:MAG: hypothetical protein A3E01_02775 [Gammaproteobacteria bacterium RIFCSPHIGHO2_12_FULL_63_22]
MECQTVVFDELTQFKEEDYLYLFSRLRRLEGSRIPIRMLSASNPGGIGNDWVKQRFIVDPGLKRTFVPAGLRDNPFLDQEEYVQALGHLDHITRAQLLDGDWDVVADGNIFKREWFQSWRAQEQQYILGPNIVPQRSFLPFGVVDLAVSESTSADYTVILCCEHDSTGTLIIRHCYRGRIGAPETLERIKALVNEYGLQWVGVEDVAYQRAMIQLLNRQGVQVRPIHPKGDKIVRAQAASVKFEQGKVWLPKDAAWVPEFERELLAFPDGSHDDQCFVADTLISTPSGPRRIDTIRVGDFVTTRSGTRKVVASGITSHSATVCRVRLSNGMELVGTRNHPVFSLDRGWIPLDAISYEDTMVPCGNQELNQNQSFLTALSSGDIPKQNKRHIEDIIGRMAGTLKEAFSTFIRKSGNLITALFLTDAISIIKMETSLTTIYQILNVYRRKNIIRFMASEETTPQQKLCSILLRYVTLLSHGINQQREKNGIGVMQNNTDLEKQYVVAPYAQNAEKTTVMNMLARASFAQENAVSGHVVNQRSTTKTEYAQHAEKCFLSAGMQSKRIVRVHAVELPAILPGRHVVYNLTIEGNHEYFSSGILVHNCDAISYACRLASNVGTSSFMPYVVK